MIYDVFIFIYDVYVMWFMMYLFLFMMCMWCDLWCIYDIYDVFMMFMMFMICLWCDLWFMISCAYGDAASAAPKIRTTSFQFHTTKTTTTGCVLWSYDVICDVFCDEIWCIVFLWCVLWFLWCVSYSISRWIRLGDLCESQEEGTESDI